MALLNSFTVVKSLFNSFTATVRFNNSSESSELTDQILENESIPLNLSAENIPDFLQISPKKNSLNRIKCRNYICTNSIYDGKSREDLINIIKRLESELAVQKCSEQSIQTELSAVSVECQTSQYDNTCDASSQTRPIPAPRLSKLKLTEDKCLPVLETKSQHKNSSPNPKTITNHSPEKVKKSSDKNLIIGSSILKGIRTYGLSKTNIRTFRGAQIDRITKEIMNMDLKAYKNIILQVVGNNISGGQSLTDFEIEYESLLLAARSCSNSDCNIIVSGLLPGLM
ncbi:unnamed protein product [Mytilus edulis]|uniref:Uncharacterized protein n=1 Tax=Mytilus edulis TaxID=6550 RepID=A0A8S3U6A0_MYTED|nr:unnamed protein product [Mytilus edulis]